MTLILLTSLLHRERENIKENPSNIIWPLKKIRWKNLMGTGSFCYRMVRFEASVLVLQLTRLGGRRLGPACRRVGLLRTCAPGSFALDLCVAITQQVTAMCTVHPASPDPQHPG